MTAQTHTKAGWSVEIQRPADRRSFWWLIVKDAAGRFISRTHYPRKVDVQAAMRAAISKAQGGATGDTK